MLSNFAIASYSLDAPTLQRVLNAYSEPVRVFLMRVVADKQMPFALKVPNAETRDAMVEADEIARTMF